MSRTKLQVAFDETALSVDKLGRRVSTQSQQILRLRREYENDSRVQSSNIQLLLERNKEHVASMSRLELKLDRTNELLLQVARALKIPESRLPTLRFRAVKGGKDE